MATGVHRIGPSQFTYFESCRLRFVLSKDDYSSYRTSKASFNRYTFLGILIHKVIEKYYKCEFQIDQFDLFWDSTLNSMIDNCIFPVHVQDKKSFVQVWSPFYSVKKEGTRRLLKDFNLIGDDVQPEKSVDAGYVKGRIDLFERNGDEIRIVDFKTGLIFKYKGLNFKEPKKEYIDQLTIYGAAFASQENVLTEKITIVLKGLSQSEFYSQRLTKKNCEDVITRLEVAIKTTAESIKGGNLDELANPSIETCRYCEFLDKCKSVQDSVSKDPVQWKNYVILNSIDSEFNYEDIEITVLINGHKISISGIPIESFHELKNKIDQGKTLFISGLYSGELPQVRRWTQYVNYFEIDNR